VLVLLALAAVIGVTVNFYAMFGFVQDAGFHGFTRWGWLLVSVAVVFVSAPNARASRRLWFGAYVVGVLILVPVTLPQVALSWQWTRVVDLTTAATAALILGMAGLFLRSRSGRPVAAGWLFALAAFAGVFGGLHLLTALATERSTLSGPPRYATVGTTLDAISVGLAAVCALVGLVARRRLPSPDAVPRVPR
jgi:hypothetical protein